MTGRLVRAEAVKLLSTRLWLVLLLCAAALTALFAGLNIAFNDDPQTLAPPLGTVAGQQLLLITAAGASQPLVAVLAAVSVTGEHRHRTVSTTFLTTPHRAHVLLAKLTINGAAGVAVTAACLLVVLAMSWPWLHALGIALDLGAGGVPETIAGILAAGAAFAAIGLGVGAIVRDQLAAVAGLLVYLFVAEPVITRIPALSEWTAYLPGPAAAALTRARLTDQDFLGPLAGGLLLAGYAVGVCVAGAVLTARRDVT